MSRHTQEIIDTARTFYALRSARGAPNPAGSERPTPIIRTNIAEQLDGFLKWCRAQQIEDPLAFLDYRFRCADHTGYVPHVHQLRSNRLASLWREWQEGEHLEEKRGETLERRAGSHLEQQVASLKILTAGHEAFKAPYAQSGQPDFCLAQIDISGGYHPESRFCPSCPRALACAVQLHRAYGFDVVSLRAGRIWALPREIAAAAVR
jgi:hypothetical protein